jgi:hypothetical protein
MKEIRWNLFVLALPWFVFWAQDYVFIGLRIVIGSNSPPPRWVLNLLLNAPFTLTLLIGAGIGWRNRFPLWTYPWLGILFFVLYRLIFEFVIQLAPRFVPGHSELIIRAFYWLLVPLALALFLAWITRRDWLLACFAAYPYTSIIMVWYTDSTPISLLVVSLALYLLFAGIFLTADSRALRFFALLAGTLLIGGGGMAASSTSAFGFLLGRNLLILSFPLCLGLMRFPTLGPRSFSKASNTSKP